MVGFPARCYDYRDYIDKHNVPYPKARSPFMGRRPSSGGAFLAQEGRVIIGLGWTGSILAQELTDAALNVVAIERGPWRSPPSSTSVICRTKLRFAIRKDLFLQPAVEAMTMRNSPSQTALPMRDYGSFLPGNAGGAGVYERPFGASGIWILRSRRTRPSATVPAKQGPAAAGLGRGLERDRAQFR